MSSVRLIDTWRTTTFRLVLLYGAMFCVGIAVLLALIYFHTRDYVTQQTDQLLKAELHSFLVTPPRDLPAALSESLQRDPRRMDIFGLFAADGRQLAGNAAEMPTELPADGTPRSLATVGTTDAGHAEPRTIRALAITLSGGSRLLVGREERQTEEIRQVLFMALRDALLIIGIGTAAGVWLSIVRVRRIQDIQRASQEIINGDISVRLPLKGSRDELDILAGIINSMMDEIEQRMRDIKGASDNIAHNLRTPLTRLRALLNRFLQSHGQGENRHLIEQAVEESEALLTRFRALLRISEISGSLRREAFDHVDLKSILQGIQDIYAPLAEEKDISLSLIQPHDTVTVWGDQALLFEAIMNLVDNAIKFTAPGGRVEVKLVEEASGSRISVIDNGPGIDPADIHLVIQPFYRSNATRATPGSGVGLSVVNAIINLHKFRFDLSSDRHGTVASIFCPHRET